MVQIVEFAAETCRSLNRIESTFLSTEVRDLVLVDIDGLYLIKEMKRRVVHSCTHVTAAENKNSLIILNRIEKKNQIVKNKINKRNYKKRS